MPTKAEVSANIATVSLAVQTLNARLADFMQEQAGRQPTYMTQAQFEAYQESRSRERTETRRAMLAAIVAIAIALIGWGITVVLTLISHKG
jgi:type VI protein secretion system component VasF